MRMIELMNQKRCVTEYQRIKYPIKSLPAPLTLATPGAAASKPKPPCTQDDRLPQAPANHFSYLNFSFNIHLKRII